MTVLQALLIAVFYYFGTSPWPFASMGTWATINRPLVAGLVVGLILGDPVTGTIMGATINIMYLGIISAGGTLPSDSGMAGSLGVALAMVGGLDTNAALALAVPLGLIGSVIFTGTMSLQCFLVVIAQKWIDEGKAKRLIWINTFIPHGIKFVLRVAVAFVALYFGSGLVTNLSESLSGPVMNALNVMGGMLPAVGIGMMLLTIFRGRAKVFLFLGFLATTFLGVGTIASALIFLCIGILIAGFTTEDFAAFSAADTRDDTFKLISKKDLVHSWLRWEYYCETLYNYERMQGIGFCNAMVPILTKLYPSEEQKPELISGLQRHSLFFNTDHNFGGCILGVCASMEEQKAAGADIPDEAFISLKSGLMGPCAGIGDTLSQVVLLPVLSVIFINLAMGGATWAPIAYTVIFLAIFYIAGYFMLMLGYKNGGEAIIKLMESGLFHKAIQVANIVGCAVAGALICSFVSFHWDISFIQNEVTVFDLQSGVFDALIPNLMPLLITLGVYTAVKKGVKGHWVTFGVMIVGFVLGLLGLVS